MSCTACLMVKRYEVSSVSICGLLITPYHFDRIAAQIGIILSLIVWIMFISFLRPLWLPLSSLPLILFYGSPPPTSSHFHSLPQPHLSPLHWILSSLSLSLFLSYTHIVKHFLPVWIASNSLRNIKACITFICLGGRWMSKLHMSIRQALEGENGIEIALQMKTRNWVQTKISNEKDVLSTITWFSYAS